MGNICQSSYVQLTGTEQEVCRSGKNIRIKTAELKFHSNSLYTMTEVEPSSEMFCIRYRTTVKPVQ
jgi:hypothetical protein